MFLTFFVFFIRSQQEIREQAKQDLKGFEETVTKDLKSFYDLKKHLVHNLQNTLNKVGALSDYSFHSIRI